uniref:Uncharacterized protein n=1 Tax=Opuntia streptacantha TaxID=393608 RepID=A0A7C9ALX0_OPUST
MEQMIPNITWNLNFRSCSEISIFRFSIDLKVWVERERWVANEMGTILLVFRERRRRGRSSSPCRDSLKVALGMLKNHCFLVYLILLILSPVSSTQLHVCVVMVLVSFF